MVVLHNPRRKWLAKAGAPFQGVRARLGAVKRPETRQRKIVQYVEMLARGETIHPQKARPE